MRLIALAQPLSDVEGAARALAAAAGLAPAEARMRLNAGPPYLVARVGDELAPAALAALRAAKLAAYELAEPLPDVAARLQVRELAFESANVRLVPRSGPPMDFAYADLTLLVVGTRVARSSSTKTTTTKKLDIGSAILTSGLKMTKTETKTERTESEQAAQELLLMARGGRCAVIGEAGMAFGCLGKDLQPGRLANFQLVVKRLRERAPGARFDDRLLRLGRRAPSLIVPGPDGGASDALDVWSALVVAAAEQGLL